MGTRSSPQPGPYTWHVVAQFQARMAAEERSQSWLSRRTDIPASTISKIVSGTRSVHLDQMVDIAEALGLDPAELIRAGHDRPR